MPVQVKLWSEDGSGGFRALQGTTLKSEEQLERSIVEDVSILSDDLLIIGRQLESPLGGRLDLLCIDRKGDLVVVELKRDRTPRDVVAQALHYASWVCDLSYEDVEALAAPFLDEGLSVAFESKFEEPFPETINTSHRIVVVAQELDAVSEVITRYLSGKWGVDINAVFFHAFSGPDGATVLARSWLMEPAPGGGSPGVGGKRGRPLPPETLSEMAHENGAGPAYDALRSGLGPLVDSVGTTRTNLAYRASLPDRTAAIVSVYPGWSDSTRGLYCDIRVSDIARYLGTSEEEVRTALPDPSADRPGYVYGEAYYMATPGEAEALVALFRRHRGTGGPVGTSAPSEKA